MDLSATRTPLACERLAAQLGHEKPTTTLQWYAHALPTATARYVDQLDGACLESTSDSLAPLAPDLAVSLDAMSR